MDVQVDRLSSLPNALIHLILSFIDIKDAIKTVALSSRYRFIWTSLPYLNFSNEEFWAPWHLKNSNADLLTLPKFSKFVTHVLSRRDTRIEVYSVKLSFRGNISHVSVKSILNYAFSHNVQQMTVTYFADRFNSDFPLSLFRSQSLKHLTLSGIEEYDFVQYITLSSTWELPDLTTLHLNYITFNNVFADLFSKCSNLKNLSLNDCEIDLRYMGGPVDVDIRHPGLSNLTLINVRDFNIVLNVVTPQLKNLTTGKWSPVNLLSAPKLDSLVFKGYHYSKIFRYSPNGLCSLEKADLCFYKSEYEEDYRNVKLEESYARKLVAILQQVRNVKYLTLNMETIQLLSSFKELISHQPSPFTNLKSLKVYPHNALSKMKETMPTEVKNYFLAGSSGATYTMVSCKEIIALRNALSIQNLMAEVWVTLEERKANFETNTSRLDSHDTKIHDKGEAQVENKKAQPVKEKKLDIEERIAKINISREDLGRQINKGIGFTSFIFDALCEIEELLHEEVPTSRRDTLQACFSSLQAEVVTVVKKIIDHMKIQCDEKQSHLSDCIQEFATKFQPFS